MRIDTYRNRYQKHVNFITKYEQAINASTGSEVDSNANVQSKNVTTMAGEIPKKDFIGTNRLLMIEKLTQMFGEDVAEEYIRQLESHEIYKHDETSIAPYCVSISMYPFVLHGLKPLGGVSGPPKHLSSFCGEFINLVFAVAAQFAGAVATPEFLAYFDHFARKEFGKDYYLRSSDPATVGPHTQTIDDVLVNCFQQVTHSLNQPAAARNYQSVFWNIAYFDEPYFHGIFDNFVFPDGDEPCWDSVNWLQKRYMKWFNHERLLVPDLTFPVETTNLLDDGVDYVDQEWADFAAEMWAEGHSFFMYRSDSVDSLASCCRLKNNITSNTFSYTLGAGGIATGSKGVITININRLVQNAKRYGTSIEDAVRTQIRKNHQYLTAFNEIIKDRFNARMLPVYDAGFIKLTGQYLTNGINGFVEGAEFLGIDISPNEEYFRYGESILRPIYEENQKAKTSEVMFNTEFVPKMCGHHAA